MKKILLIDDEPGLTRLLRIQLEKTGLYEVEEQNDSLSAIEHIRRFQPDLVLLDVMMPGKDGDEIAAEMDDDPRIDHIPCVFLTSIVTPGETGGGVADISGRRFLAKPVKTAELLDVVAEVLGEP